MTHIKNQIEELKEYIQSVKVNYKDSSMKTIKCDIIDHLLGLILKNLDQIGGELEEYEAVRHKNMQN